jgi:hypothetical protein
MDTVTLKETIKRILREYAAFGKPPGEVETELIFDDEGGHYEMMFVGWNGLRRIHGSVIHIDLRGDKIWIQHDGTRDGVAEDLMDAGIPPERIVLGFRSPDERKHSIFAVN